MFKGISPDAGMWPEVRDGLLTAGFGSGVGWPASSLSDFGAGGAKYDLRLCLSIMLIAHS